MQYLVAIFQHDCTGSNTLNGGLWICIKMKKNQENKFIVIIFASPAFPLGTEDYFPKNVIVTKYSLFGGEIKILRALLFLQL